MLKLTIFSIFTTKTKEIVFQFKILYRSENPVTCTANMSFKWGNGFFFVLNFYVVPEIYYYLNF